MSPVSYTVRRPCVVFLYFVSLIIGARGACQVPDRLVFAEPRPGELDKDIFPAGTTVSYNCRPGLVRVPGSKNSITCLPDYTWSPPDVFCQRRSCGNPGEIANGDIEATDFLFGSTVTYTCNKGYRLTSRWNSRQCQADGTWSNAVPECEAEGKSCGNPGNIDHGKMAYENFLSGSRVTYSCNEGYTMISRNNYRYCQADGTWSGKAPVCKESVCEKIWELQEEARTCTSTPDEWIKYLQVQYLYLQIENLKLEIELKKKELVS